MQLSISINKKKKYLINYSFQLEDEKVSEIAQQTEPKAFFGMTLHTKYEFFIFQAVGLTLPIRFEDHVRLNAELPQQGYTLRRLQVDGHRLFPSGLRVQRPGRLGPVHADHLCPKISQDHSAERCRCQASKFNHSHSSQSHNHRTGEREGILAQSQDKTLTMENTAAVYLLSITIEPVACCSQWAALQYCPGMIELFLLLWLLITKQCTELSNKCVL